MSHHSEMLAISTCCSGSILVLRLFFSDWQVVVFSVKIISHMVVWLQIELLNFRRSRFEEEPIALEEALALTQAGGETSSTSDALQYRKVYCEGVFDESKSVFVGPRSRTLYGAAEKGYYIVTPLFCRSTSDDR